MDDGIVLTVAFFGFLALIACIFTLPDLRNRFRETFGCNPGDQEVIGWIVEQRLIDLHNICDRNGLHEAIELAQFFGLGQCVRNAGLTEY